MIPPTQVLNILCQSSPSTSSILCLYGISPLTYVTLSPVKVSELTEEQKEYLAKLETEKAEAAASGSGTTDNNKGASTIFHGKAEKDYQGRWHHLSIYFIHSNINAVTPQLHYRLSLRL